MARIMSVVLLTLAVIGCASASDLSNDGRDLKQIFGPGGFFGPALPPTAPGAGRSVADVVCARQDLSDFCNLIKVAQRDPTVAELLDPTFTGTVFVPDNSAVKDTQGRLTRTLGVSSVADLARSPALAARVVGNHIITGQALQFSQLKNDQKYKDALGSTLEIDEGFLYGKYVKGPVNTVRISGTAGKNDIPAARAYLHYVDGVIVPKRASTGK